MAHERILVADDHDSLRRGIVRALKDAGHDVDEASDGNAAIELLHKGQFDVVLSDLKMGGSDGLEVLRTAKALHPTASVILMTGFGSVQTARGSLRTGRRWESVPRRSRRHECEHAGQDPSGAARA